MHLFAAYAMSSTIGRCCSESDSTLTTTYGIDGYLNAAFSLTLQSVHVCTRKTRTFHDSASGSVTTSKISFNFMKPWRLRCLDIPLVVIVAIPTPSQLLLKPLAILEVGVLRSLSLPQHKHSS
ncbi:hypothetical protein SCHPADRAFT_551343 [Schizopora paradoxa]|uniref:Uncharacterized protein n=1 Tax=Schizopora paradoxa TaxID=27342 RepID=A0A0H2RCZ9_9AGAM|nr:hypothetical protein SCHPADRAFT_551343 [Schizopora paradoxa]